MRRLSVAGVALAIVVLATVALAAENPTGTWKWTMAGRGGGPGREMTLKLKLEGDKLTGAAIGRNDEEIPIADAKYKDGELSFSVTREFQGNNFTQKYTGKLSGDTIKGKIEMPGRDGGDPISREWEAKRAEAAVAAVPAPAAAGSPTGTWKWTQAGRAGGTGREVTLKLKLDGDKLTGALVGRNDQETAIADGKFKDGELSFSVTTEGRDGTKRTSKYAGKLAGDTIKGKIEGPGRGGETTSREWEAKRAKAEETKK